MATRQEVAALLVALWQQYLTEPTSSTCALWHSALGHYPIETLQRAGAELLLTYEGTIAPTIGMLAAIVRRQNDKTEETLSEGEAWSILQNAIRRFGSYNQAGAMHDIRQRSALVERCAQLLGWREICSWRTDDEVANRAHFWRVFNGLKREAQLAALPSGQDSRLALVESVVKSIGSGGNNANRR